MEYLKVKSLVPIDENNPFLLSWLKSGREISILLLKKRSSPVAAYFGENDKEFLDRAGWKFSERLDFKEKGRKIFVKGDSRLLRFTKENYADGISKILNEEEDGFVELSIKHYYFGNRKSSQRYNNRHNDTDELSRKSAERSGWKAVVKFKNNDVGSYLSHIFSSPGLVTRKGKIGFSFPILAWWEVSQFIPSRIFVPDNEGIRIGHNKTRGNVYLNPQKNFHTLISGSTGSGKSTLIVGMMKDIIQNKAGKVILIDPHGDTAKKMEESVAKKFIISPDSSNSINVLRGTEDQGISYRIAEDFVSILKSVREVQYTEAFVGPRMEDLISRGISSLTKIKGTTLVDFYNILKDESSRKKIYDSTADSGIRKFIEELNLMTREEKIGTERAIGRLTNDPFVRSLICNPDDSGLLAKGIKENDLIIVNLERGNMGYEDSRLLSNIFAVYIWFILSSMRGTNYYLFLEEAQDYQSNFISDMISSGRKFGLRIFFVTTSFVVISEKLEALLFSNISNYIFLKMSDPDKSKVSKFLGRNLIFPSEPLEFLLVNSNGEEIGDLEPVNFENSISQFKEKDFDFITGNKEKELSQQLDELFSNMENCSSILFVIEEFSHYFRDYEKREVIAAVKGKISELRNVNYVGRVTLTTGRSKARYECFEIVGKGEDCSSVPNIFLETSSLLSRQLERK